MKTLTKTLILICASLLFSCAEKHSKEKQTVQEFISAINSADIDKITELMHDEHVFVDIRNNKIEGKEKMKKAWKAYYEWVPNYKIEVNDVLVRDSVIGVFGTASGTYSVAETDSSKRQWEIPAAWYAIVRDGKIKYWQIYKDR